MMPVPIADPRAFIVANTRLTAVPHVPEILVHVADEPVPLWEKTEDELRELGLPPPYWAFAWAGGQALARYVLERPELVAKKRVLDLASGSGLVGIAAAKAGAVPVIAAEIDPFAQAAIALNMEANGVYLDIVAQDLLDHPAPPTARYDVILVGDFFYEDTPAARTFAFLRRHAAVGTRVLVGDPGRAYLPRERLEWLCEYKVPVTRALEDQDVKHTSVWSLGT
jgi:predicted nicotinamide N-methyase